MYSKENSRIENNYRVHVKPHIDGVCAVCGDSFKSGSSLAKYCSRRCLNDASIARRRLRIAEKRAIAKKCAVCDTPIEQGGGKIAIYCSNSCKQKAYRKRVKK
ncbi:MAG: hypothetical protein FWF78_01675 [Defluviitaleaceae bacterium]|nr:hypothetical protein [Defluviitaleaceae bacterium]